MSDSEARNADTPQAPGAQHNALGKRYQCRTCGGIVLCTKAGGGAVECCGQPMLVLEPKPLPSSD
jgi:desulfoferrodoxin-like iron-binding protein